MDQKKGTEQVLLMRNPNKIYDKERTIIGNATQVSDLISAMKDEDVDIEIIGERTGSYHISRKAVGKFVADLIKDSNRYERQSIALSAKKL
ncbi:MAG: hypothetical protein JNL51_00210 [Chitinophagaceae bacterium]|nr:hypothetical protein [Chitinophagaceae bacterium]